MEDSSYYMNPSYENPLPYNVDDQQRLPVIPSGPSVYDIDDQDPVIPPAESAYHGQQTWVSYSLFSYNYNYTITLHTVFGQLQSLQLPIDIVKEF